MAHVFQALTLLPPALRFEVQKGYSLNLQQPQLLWTIRSKCASYIEGTLLSTLTLGFPIDPMYKLGWVASLRDTLYSLGSHPEADVLCQFQSDVEVIQCFDTFRTNIESEVRHISDFWIRNIWQELEVCKELFSNDQVPLTVVTATTGMKQVRLTAGITTLIQLAQPFLDQPPLPISQHFCSWIPSETLKANYLRLACALDRIHQVAAAVRLRCGNLGVLNEMEMESITTWEQKTNYARHNLVLHSMIVTRQPGHCVKKNSRIELEVKILDTNYLQLNANNTQLNVAVLNFDQAKILHESPVIPPNILQGCTRIAKEVRFTQPGDLTAHVTVVVPDRPATKEVLKEKYYILFSLTSYGMGAEATGRLAPGIVTGAPDGNAFGIQVWTCTAPFVITTNDNQRRRGNFTIFWDLYVNALNQFDYTVSPTVSQICTGFAEYTKKKTQTTWKLPDISLKYLVASVLHEPNLSLDTKIPRDRLDRIGFARWEWYYESLQLIKDYFRDHWDRGYIIGFINRADAEKQLQIAGGFLFRFSESESGRLVITHNFSGHQVESEFLEEIMIRHLSKFVRDIKGLVYLYHVKTPALQIGITNKMDAFPPSPPSSPSGQGGRGAPYKRLITMTFS